MRRLRTATFAIVACLLGSAAGLAPDTLWVKRLDLGSDESGYGIAVRGDAIVVVGNAWTGTSNDIMVAKLDQDGDTIWTRTCDGGYDDAAISVCLDAESNAFVAGFAMAYKDAGASARRPDVFGRARDAFAEDLQEIAYTAKYDSLGERKWLRIDTNHIATGVASDSAGNLFVAGAVNTGAGYDLWFAKLNTAGDTIWTRTYDLAMFEIGYRLTVCPDGNLAGCAYLGDYGDLDCLVLRLTPDGDTLWTRRFNQGPDDGGSAVAVDSSGNIIVAGRCANDTVSDGLVLKYSSSGDLLWQQVYDLNTDDGLLGVTCNSAGDIYVTGYTGSDYVNDCLTMKLDAMGKVLWTATYGGPGDDQGGDVACGPNGNPVIAGYVMDSLSYGYDVLALEYGALTGVAESPTRRPAPTPARSTITAAPYFVLAVPGSGRYDIRLCDLNGRTRRPLFHGSLSEGAHRFSLAGLPAGHYIVRVAAPAGGVSSQRLVLVK